MVASVVTVDTAVMVGMAVDTALVLEPALVQALDMVDRAKAVLEAIVKALARVPVGTVEHLAAVGTQVE